MTTTEAILNYASIRKEAFRRTDLLYDIAQKQMDIKAGAVDLQINRLIASGVLLRKGRGEYLLAENSLPEFVYTPSKTEKDLFLKLKKRFPFLDMCVWSPKVLSFFMLHVPNVEYIFVDVEKEGMESVFHALQDMNLHRNVLLAPSPKDCERYLTGTDAIVVRRLIGQSPLTESVGCTVPRIEKILVDAVGDNEMLFAEGSEIYHIYEYVRERNHINMNKLIRYASRRNRKEKIERIINAIDYDKSKK